MADEQNQETTTEEQTKETTTEEQTKETTTEEQTKVATTEEQTKVATTEEQTKVATTEEQKPQQAQFQLQKLYTKDVSFEIPNAPQIFQEDGQVEIKMNLAQRVENLSDNVHEVVLTVTVTASLGDKTAYLAEVQQAGIFAISGLNEQAMHAALNTLCPNTLFPYTRRLITDLVAEGGFPPLVLQPINFDQIYAQRLQEAQSQTTSAEETAAQDMEVQGNA